MTHLKTTCTNSSNVRNISLCKNCIEKTLAKQSILYNVINLKAYLSIFRQAIPDPRRNNYRISSLRYYATFNF